MESTEGVLLFEEDIHSFRAKTLLASLSAELESITGDSGRNSFDSKDAELPRSAFVIAIDGLSNESLGCGAIRPVDTSTAELKRMYSSRSGRGIGTSILGFLESKSRYFGYSRIVLETRRVNTIAVRFYLSKKYREIPNYGKYVGRAECICFEKEI